MELGIWRSGKIDKAVIALEERAEKGEPKAWRIIGSIFEHENRSADALLYFEKAADAGDVESIYHLGTILEIEGKKGEAVKKYNLAASKGLWFGYARLGELARAEGDMKSSLTYYKEASAIGVPATWFRYATLLLEQDLHSLDALDLLEKAAAKGHIESALLLGRIARSMGDSSAAEDYFQLAGPAGYFEELMLDTSLDKD